MRALAVLVSACLLAVLLAGCANRIDYNRSSANLSLGMSKSDVQGVLGSPRRTEVNEARERWVYWSPARIGLAMFDNESLSQDRLVVTFVDSKVVKWGQQTLTDDMMESQQKSMESSMKFIQQMNQK